MNKIKYSLPIVALMLIMLVGVVSAGTCTWTAPGASARISGTYEMIISDVNTSIGNVVKNCTIAGTSALTGDTWTVGTTVNDTGTDAQQNLTVSTLAEYDASDWILTATCKNSSGTTLFTCTRTTTIDNTVPVVRSCKVNNETAANGTVGSSDTTFFCTVANATTCNAYWKTTTALAFASSAASRSDLKLNAITMSNSYPAGVIAFANVYQVEDDAKNIYYTCSDGLNSTSSYVYTLDTTGYSKTQLKAKVNSLTGAVTYVDTARTKNTVFLILVAVCMLFIVIAAFAYKKK